MNDNRPPYSEATALIVHDNSAEAAMLSTECRAAGLEVIICRTLEDGLMVARSSKPEVVLVPVTGGASGFQPLQLFQTATGSPTIVGLLHVGVDPAEVLARGAAACISLPPQGHEIVRALEKVDHALRMQRVAAALYDDLDDAPAGAGSLPPINETSRWSMPPRDFSPLDLTQEQRAEVFDFEKRRLEAGGPVLTTRQKAVLALYLLGCVVLYSGVIEWIAATVNGEPYTFQPKLDSLMELGEAALTLIRPLLAAWAFLLPFGILYCFWVACDGMLKGLIERWRGY